MLKTVRKGQALLIILLVMVVGLTIGLSLSTRSVSDLSVSGQTEDSTRAFAAAEAGIETVLGNNTGIGSTGTVGNASYTVTTSMAGGNDLLFSLGDINIADTYTVWLTTHDASGNLQTGTAYDYNGNTIDVCWDKADSSSDVPAMEVSFLYKDGAGLYKVSRGAYDPDASRTASNKFNNSNVSNTVCAGKTQNKVTIDLSIVGETGAKIALRLRPFYAKAAVTVIPSGNNLSGQGLSISSIGTAGQTTRKVMVTQSYSSLPSIFDYVLFSGKDVNK